MRVLSLLMLPSVALAMSGSGTAGDPYQVTTCQELEDIENDRTAHYLVVNDIDCLGHNFTRIGRTQSNAFTGGFRGGGHTISNLTVSGNSAQGLFGNIVSPAAPIGDVRLDNLTVTGTGSWTGGFVGRASDAVFEDIEVNGIITGLTRAGGIAAQLQNGDVTGCTVDVAVTATQGSNTDVGGVVGLLSGTSATPSTVTDCIVQMTSNPSSAQQDVGGVAGAAVDVTFTHIDATVSIQGDNQYAGGIAGGCTPCTLQDLSLDVDLAATNAGGISGWSRQSTVSDAFITGSATGTNAAGGVYGSSSNFSQLHARIQADVNVTAPAAGGFIGIISGQGGVFEDARALGTLSGTEVGGAAGRLVNTAGLRRTLTRPPAVGTQVSGGPISELDVVYATAADVAAGTVDEVSEYPASWDFTNIWSLDGTNPADLQTVPGFVPPGVTSCTIGTLFDWNGDGDDDGCRGTNVDVGPSAMVPPGSIVGDDVTIGNFVNLGSGVTLDDGTTVAPGASVGSGTTLGPNSFVGRSVTLGANNDFSDGCVFSRRADIGSNNVISGPCVIAYSAQVGSNNQVVGGLTMGNLAQLGDQVTTTGVLRIGRSAIVGALGGAAVSLGDDTRLGPDAQIADDVTGGDDLILRKGASVAATSVLGDLVTLGILSDVEAGVTLPLGTVVRARARICSGDASFGSVVPRGYVSGTCL